MLTIGTCDGRNRRSIESVWPNPQAEFAKGTTYLDEDATERLAWKDASDLFRFPGGPRRYRSWWG